MRQKNIVRQSGAHVAMTVAADVGLDVTRGRINLVASVRCEDLAWKVAKPSEMPNYRITTGAKSESNLTESAQCLKLTTWGQTLKWEIVSLSRI